MMVTRVNLLHSLTYYLKLTVGLVKKKTLGQKRWFDFPHFELIIYM